jgi:ribonucleotide reductase alpha subunit
MEHKFKLTETFISKYKDLKAPFGFNGLGELVYMRTYSRIKNDGQNEKWYETVRRVVEGTYSMQKRWIEEHDLGWDSRRAQNSAQEMFDRIFNMKFLPPGRGLWAMGSDIIEEKGIHAALNNCGFVSTKNLKDDLSKPFTFLMDASMLGVGVGFDTKGAGSLVVKGINESKGAWTFVIPDSREGWVESLQHLLESYFLGLSKVDFDYSQVRPEGLPIKGFGGVSSGPEPLKEMHNLLRKVLDLNSGELITVTTIVDIMNIIGKAVVAGNVRRTAEIVFGEYDSQEFINLKDYNVNPERESFGWTSNNSIFAKIGMDYSAVSNKMAINGEPGLAWLSNMQSYSRMNNGPDNKDHRASGGNPCKPLNSLILTDSGYIPFAKAIADKSELSVITPLGVKKATIPFKTGENQGVYEVTLSNGIKLYGTGNHLHMDSKGNWVRMDELKIGSKLKTSVSSIYSNSDKNEDRYNLGLLLGWLHTDGSHYVRPDGQVDIEFAFGKNEFDVIPLFESLLGVSAKPHSQKPDTCKIIRFKSKSTLEKFKSEGYNFDKSDLTWLYGKDYSFKLGFISAAFTADGSFRKDNCCELYSSRYSALQVLQHVLLEFGISATLTTHSNAKSYVAKDGKQRNNKPTYKLVVRRNEFKAIGFISNYKQSKLALTETMPKSKFIDYLKVVSIDPCYSVEDVYDITVHSDEHLFVDTAVVTHNCLEQTLESMELCCLVETFPNNHANVEDYIKTLKYAYLYAKTVTLGKTHWPETNRVLLRNRRIGCSMSGIAQFVAQRGINELKDWCQLGYDAIHNYDISYSDWFAIPRSIKTTSIKPSGTVSLLAGATPGIHFPENRFYIRRMRLSKHSQLVKPLEKAGYKVEPAFGSEDSTVVVEIPVDSGEGVRTVSEVSMWEQLSLAAFLQKYWADNQVSATVTFDPKTEASQIEHALNYFQYQLKGISFLPRLPKGAYRQMPYESITEEVYSELKKKLKAINFNKVSNESADVEKFCNNDVCEIGAKK